MVDKQEQAMQKVKENDLERAAQLFIEYTEDHPEDPIGYINVGNLLAQMNQYEESERFLLKALELDKRLATAYYGLGNIYLMKEIFETALQMFSKAISLGMEEADVYYLTGLAHLRQESPMLAIPFLQRAMELEDTSENTFQYALTLAKCGYEKEARQVFLGLIDKEPNHADSLYNLAVIALNEGDGETLIHYLNLALDANPTHTMALEVKEGMLKSKNLKEE